MRTTFAKQLLALAKKDSRIILLTGDLGYSVFEEFQKKLPDQYLNMGVAEQNMTGAAAGMALEGYIPVIYSIVPFATMRNFEQIRNDICYQNLNVKIVGVGAGFSYGPYGHTHHGLEDVGILRTLPNIIILAPGDPVETSLAVRAMMHQTGPVYLRLGKAGEPQLYVKPPKFKIGHGIVIKEGSRVTLIAASVMLETAVLAAKNLSWVRVVSMPCIKPIDKPLILDCAKKTKAIVTLEEHSITGGLGSAVAEVLAEAGASVRLKRIAVPDRFTRTIGLQAHMRKANGLSVPQVVRILKGFK
jgi:transketolase